ncbi:MAG: EamA family transporter [Anaerolineae bacterium]|nr:EamA family transporter [Anaerolineae bacterium]
MTTKWIGFWVLGLIWGSSFLLIRIGVESVSPFQLVFIRVLIGAVGLALVLFARGRWLPMNRGGLMALFILGMINVTIPFALITWGEQTVESGVASVLNSTAALFTLIISAFIFRQEAFTGRKLAGLLVGFAGVVVLASRNWQGGEMQTGSLLGQLAILLAALFYAFGGSYAYRLTVRWGDPLMVAAGSMIVAAVSSGLLMVLAPAFGGKAMTPLNEIPADAMLSLLGLGILNTFIAYMIYYWIIHHLGASRASMVTYVAPVVGLTLGALVLGETMDARLIGGAAMILSGIAIVTLKVRRPVPTAVTAAQVET